MMKIIKCVYVLLHSLNNAIIDFSYRIQVMHDVSHSAISKKEGRIWRLNGDFEEEFVGNGLGQRDITTDFF